MSTVFRVARPAFRARTFFRPNNTITTRNAGARRFQSTTSGAAAEESWGKKFWNSEKGPKTVHFWYFFLDPSHLPPVPQH